MPTNDNLQTPHNHFGVNDRWPCHSLLLRKGTLVKTSTSNLNSQQETTMNMTLDKMSIYLNMNSVVNVTWHSPWHNPWHTRGTIRTKIHEVLCTSFVPRHFGVNDHWPCHSSTLRSGRLVKINTSNMKSQQKTASNMTLEFNMNIAFNMNSVGLCSGLRPPTSPPLTS